MSEVLKEHGLGEWLQTGGYAEAAFFTLLNNLPRLMQTAASATRAQRWIERVIEWARRSEGELRFPSLNQSVAKALLLPWVSSEPTAAVEKLLTAFLVTPPMLGDPRLQRSKWHGVKPEASTVLERWLNRETLNAVVRIVKEATKDDEVAEDHWRERHDFWMAYYDVGHISKVWIALGPEAAKIAQRYSNLNGQFGHLTKQRMLNHSVLLLQIGSLLVADWSHNGSCRIWTESSACKLKFSNYEREYWGEELRAPSDKEKRHQGDWQSSIRGFIQHQTGIRVPRKLRP